MNKKTVKDIDVTGKRVLVRCDFNVPQDKEGNITDNRRIVAALDTIKYLIEKNAKVILCSHLGRPKGEFKDEFTLKPVAEELSRLLGQKVELSKDVIGEDSQRLVDNLQNGQVILLENVRFHAEEEKNDPEFAKKLANFADVYVNDAFGTAHRAHASTEGVAKYLPAVAGFLMEKEIEFLGSALENPQRPFVAILGGKKVSDKISVIENLLEKVDTLIIAGGMAYTFLKSQGLEIGKSVCEDDKIDLAKQLLENANQKNVKILLPVDINVAEEIDENIESKIVNIDEIPQDCIGLDVGPKTIELFAEELKKAKTVVWNGPLGIFEIDKFAVGTNAIAKILSEINATTIIGGGDSASAIEKAGLSNKMTHISTGGGASLEFLEGKELPGVVCLLDKF